MIVLKNLTQSAKEKWKDMCGNVEELKNHVDAHEIYENIKSVNDMMLRVKSAT